MKFKIIKYDSGENWYKDLVGKIIEIKDYKNPIKIMENYYYQLDWSKFIKVDNVVELKKLRIDKINRLL